MSGPKWTPGPWEATSMWSDCTHPACPRHRLGITENDCDGKDVYRIVHVIYVNQAGHSLDKDERQANAYLISAAPDLADALHDVLADITTDAEEWAEGSSVYRARAALRKARGEG